MTNTGGGGTGLGVWVFGGEGQIIYNAYVLRTQIRVMYKKNINGESVV